MQAFSAAGQEMYQAQAAEAGAPEDATDEEAGDGTGNGAAEDDDVMEADYEIVDDEK